jgi:hypothetical protein
MLVDKERAKAFTRCSIQHKAIGNRIPGGVLPGNTGPEFNFWTAFKIRRNYSKLGRTFSELQMPYEL